MGVIINRVSYINLILLEQLVVDRPPEESRCQQVFPDLVLGFLHWFIEIANFIAGESFNHRGVFAAGLQ